LNRTVTLLNECDYSDNAPRPVVCGGSMMYIDWLINGLPTAPSNSHEAQVRAAVDDLDYSDWCGFLRHVREAFSEQIEGLPESQRMEFEKRLDNTTRNDVYRLRRTLSVMLHRAGTPSDERLFSEDRVVSPEQAGFDYRLFFLCPTERREHHHLIDSRCEEMLANGLLEEVCDLIVQHNFTDTAAAKAIGYRQTIEYLLNDRVEYGSMHHLTEYIANFKAKTRQYAKQQQQWFRKEKSAMFVGVNVDGSNFEDVVDTVTRLGQVSREEWERELVEGHGTAIIQKNKSQGKGMRTFRSVKFESGARLDELLLRADECRRIIRSAGEGTADAAVAFN
jgi:tRNA A37 N6-isopentenylltransferase MiaA